MDEDPIEILWELHAGDESLAIMQEIAELGNQLVLSLGRADEAAGKLFDTLDRASAQAFSLGKNLDFATRPRDSMIRVVKSGDNPDTKPGRTPSYNPPSLPPSPDRDNDAFSIRDFRQIIIAMRPLLGQVGMHLVGGAGRSALYGLNLLGMGNVATAAMPYLMAAGAVAGVASAFVKLETHTMTLIAQFQKASDQIGATGASGRTQAGEAFGIGSGIGMSEAQVASRARSLMERIATDPVAMGIAAQMGARALPGPYGTLDASRSFIQIVEGLRNITDEEMRLRAARILGAEDLLELTHMSEQQLARMREIGALRGAVQSPESMERAADFTAAQREVSESWALLTLSMKDLGGSALTELMRAASDVLQGLAFGIRSLRSIFGGDALNGIHSQQRELVDALKGRAGEMEGNTAALARLTKAVENDPRIMGAIPSSLRGQNLTRAIEAGTVPLGVF